MSKSVKNESVDLDHNNKSEISRKDFRNGHLKIKPLISRTLMLRNPRDYVKIKRIKKCQALAEEETSFIPFVGSRRQFLLSSYYSQKHTHHIALEISSIDEIIKIMSKLFPKYSSLRGLHLNFSEDIKNEAWARIGGLLSRFSRLKILTLKFHQKRPELKDSELYRLSRSLSKLAMLKNINFSLTQDDVFLSRGGFLKASFASGEDQNAMRIISHMVSHLVKLESFNITITEQEGITDEGLEGLGSMLAKLNSLKRVGFDFRGCRSLTFQGINVFLTYLSKINCLESIRMALSVCDKFDDSSEIPLKHPIWKNQKLRNVILIFKMVSMFPPDILEAIVSSIENIQSLKRLVVDFYSCHGIGDKTVENFVYACAKLPKLIEVSMSFVSCLNLRHSTAYNLLYAFTTFPCLEILRLTFQSCFKRIAVNGVEFEGALQRLPHLRELAINLMDCTELKDNQIDRVAELVGNCPNLKDVSLNLGWCRIVTDYHVQKIITAVSPLEHINQLTLSFEGCDKVTSESLFEMKKLIKNNQLLKYLDINLSSWSGVINSDLGSLGEAIHTLKNLEGLRINLKNCKNITDEGVQMFFTSFLGLYKLNTIMMAWNCDNIRETSKAITAIIGTSLPNLYYVEFLSTKKNGHVSKSVVRFCS